MKAKFWNMRANCPTKGSKYTQNYALFFFTIQNSLRATITKVLGFLTKMGDAFPEKSPYTAKSFALQHNRQSAHTFGSGMHNLGPADFKIVHPPFRR